jgi:hypothetical protein
MHFGEEWHVSAAHRFIIAQSSDSIVSLIDRRFLIDESSYQHIPFVNLES